VGVGSGGIGVSVGSGGGAVAVGAGCAVSAGVGGKAGVSVGSGRRVVAVGAGRTVSVGAGGEVGVSVAIGNGVSVGGSGVLVLSVAEGVAVGTGCAVSVGVGGKVGVGVRGRVGKASGSRLQAPAPRKAPFWASTDNRARCVSCPPAAVLKIAALVSLRASLRAKQSPPSQEIASSPAADGVLLAMTPVEAFSSAVAPPTAWGTVLPVLAVRPGKIASPEAKGLRGSLASGVGHRAPSAVAAGHITRARSVRRKANFRAKENGVLIS
jgi:hypothetical protein